MGVVWVGHKIWITRGIDRGRSGGKSPGTTPGSYYPLLVMVPVSAGRVSIEPNHVQTDGQTGL